MKDTFPTNQKCSCHGNCSHLLSRRWFMRSLLTTIISIPLLEFAKLALSANHHATALVLSCIDFRFIFVITPSFNVQFQLEFLE